MMPSRTEQVRELIRGYLSDGQPRSLDEIRRFVVEQDESLLTSANMLNTIVGRLCRNDPRYYRPQKSIYQFQPEAVAPVPREDGGEDGSAQTGLRTRHPLTPEDILAELRQLSDRIDIALKQPSYEMSEQEFLRYQSIYRLKKQVAALLASYSGPAGARKGGGSCDSQL